jgi:hypothetical protein
MKLKLNTSPVEISGVTARPSRFRITANREAFKILSSGLYSNKIRAIIRELSCNAVDSHVAAGREGIPFFVHLPTNFEPTFSIKDTGTGLAYCEQGCVACRATGRVEIDGREEQCGECNGTGSYDAVLDLYTCYFNSSRSNSNDFTGALGLGSKSPLCYEAAEGFTLVNTFNGVRRIYTCFINEEGMPDVLLQDASATDEHSGVEVSFPVDTKDVYEFKNQAEEVWEFFTPRPEVNIHVNIREQDYKFRSARWGLRRDYDNYDVRAIQGRVQYSIGNIDESRLTPTQQDLIQMNLDLFFDIGELEVAASRESLSNSEDTIAAVLGMLNEVETSMLADIRASFSKCENYWQFMLELFSLENTDGIGKIVKAARKNGDLQNIRPEWKLPTGNEAEVYLDQTEWPHLLFAYFDGQHYGEQCSKIMLNKVIPSGAQPLKNTYMVRFGVESNAVFIVNDVGFGAEKYIHSYLKDHSREKGSPRAAYFITRTGKDIPLEYVKKKALELLLKIGRPPLVLLSALKEKYKDVNASSSREAVPTRDIVKLDIYYAAHNSNRRGKGWRDSWDTLPTGYFGNIPADQRKFYLPIKALEPTVGDFRYAEDVGKLVKALRATASFDWDKNTELYGVRESKVRALDYSWVNLVEHIKAEHTQVFTPQWEAGMALINQDFKCRMKKFLEFIAEKLPLGVTSPLQRFAVRYNVTKNMQLGEADEWKKIVAVVQRWTSYAPAPARDFTEEWEEIKTQYPLFTVLDSWWFENKRDVFASLLPYVRAIEEERDSNNALLTGNPDQLSLLSLLSSDNPDNQIEENYETVN